VPLFLFILYSAWQSSMARGSFRAHSKMLQTSTTGMSQQTTSREQGRLAEHTVTSSSSSTMTASFQLQLPPQPLHLYDFEPTVPAPQVMTSDGNHVGAEEEDAGVSKPQTQVIIINAFFSPAYTTFRIHRHLKNSVKWRRVFWI